MAINQISTANTFEQWLIATQSLIAFANSITDAPPGGSFTSNTEEYIITGNLTLGNTLTCATMNTDVIIFDDGTRLTSNVFIINSYDHANGAFDHANGAFDHANGAFDQANSANVLAQQAYDYANTIGSGSELAGDNVQVLYTVTGNNIVANISVTTANITVTSNVTTSNITVSNNITVTSNVTTSNITVSNNITVTKNITAGNITTTLISATDFDTTSDIALKNNMQQITNSLDVLEKITGFTFNWKSDGRISYGVSAQEVEQIIPEAVRLRDDGYRGVNYLNLIAFLIEAVKDLKKEIMEIKNNNK